MLLLLHSVGTPTVLVPGWLGDATVTLLAIDASGGFVTVPRSITIAGVGTVTLQSAFQQLDARSLTIQGLATVALQGGAIEGRSFVISGLAAVNLLNDVIQSRLLAIDGTSGGNFLSAQQLLVGRTFGIQGSADVNFVSSSIEGRTFAIDGIASVNLQSQQQALESRTFTIAGAGAVILHGSDASAGTLIDPRFLNIAGFANVTLLVGATQGRILSIAGIADTDLQSDFITIVVEQRTFGIAGFAVVNLKGVDTTLPPAGNVGNLFVPVRYVVGIRDNVVPVETVLVGGIDIVPVREFVGPDNVVPVREAPGEITRVKVVKV